MSHLIGPYSSMNILMYKLHGERVIACSKWITAHHNVWNVKPLHRKVKTSTVEDMPVDNQSIQIRVYTCAWLLEILELVLLPCTKSILVYKPIKDKCRYYERTLVGMK